MNRPSDRRRNPSHPHTQMLEQRRLRRIARRNDFASVADYLACYAAFIASCDSFSGPEDDGPENARVSGDWGFRAEVSPGA